MALPIPFALVSPRESRNRTGPITVTQSGAVREVPFTENGPPSWFVEEGTTNHHLNPIPTSASGFGPTGWYMWASSGTVRTMSIDNSFSFDGIASWFRIDFSDRGANGNTLLLWGSRTSASFTNTPITISMYVASSRTQSVNLRLQVEVSGTYTTVETKTVTIGPTPVRVDASYVIPDGTTVTAVRLAFPNNVNGLQDGDIYWLSGGQVELKAYPTSFAAGSMGTGYSWDGTPNNSASTRAYSRAWVTEPMPADQGSWYIRYKVGTTPTSRCIGGFGSIGDAGSRALVGYVGSSNQFLLRQGQSVFNSVPGAPTGIPNSMYAEYLPSTVAVDYRDGGGKRSATRTGDPPPPTWGSDRLAIGYSGDQNDVTTLPINGNVAALLAFDRPLADSEIADLDSLSAEQLQTWSTYMPRFGGVSISVPTTGEILLNTSIPTGGILLDQTMEDI